MTAMTVQEPTGRLLRVYLAGAIRDDHPEDISWRESLILLLRARASFLNPLAGKTYSKSTHLWEMAGVIPNGRLIVKQDFWCIDHADIVVFNFGALADGYPMIGSLVEFGRATARGVLIYSIIPEGFTGHENRKLYKLHPFLEENSAVVFPDRGSCGRYLETYLDALSGVNPNFGGVVA